MLDRRAFAERNPTRCREYFDALCRLLRRGGDAAPKSRSATKKKSGSQSMDEAALSSLLASEIEALRAAPPTTDPGADAHLRGRLELIECLVRRLDRRSVGSRGAGLGLVQVLLYRCLFPEAVPLASPARGRPAAREHASRGARPRQGSSVRSLPPRGEGEGETSTALRRFLRRHRGRGRARARDARRRRRRNRRDRRRRPRGLRAVLAGFGRRRGGFRGAPPGGVRDARDAQSGVFAPRRPRRARRGEHAGGDGDAGESAPPRVLSRRG